MVFDFLSFSPFKMDSDYPKCIMLFMHSYLFINAILNVPHPFTHGWKNYICKLSLFYLLNEIFFLIWVYHFFQQNTLVFDILIISPICQNLEKIIIGNLNIFHGCSILFLFYFYLTSVPVLNINYLTYKLQLTNVTIDM